MLEPWSDHFPFAAGQKLVFRVAIMMVGINGEAVVEENDGGRLTLSGRAPEQMVLGKRVPETRFSVALDHSEDGLRCTLQTGDAPPITESEARMTTQGRRRRLRIGAGTKAYAFTIEPGRDKVTLRDLEGAKIPRGAKIVITPAR